MTSNLVFLIILIAVWITCCAIHGWHVGLNAKTFCGRLLWATFPSASFILGTHFAKLMIGATL